MYKDVVEIPAGDVGAEATFVHDGVALIIDSREASWPWCLWPGDGSRCFWNRQDSNLQDGGRQNVER